MSTPTTQLVRPAGAGHETLYVLLLCLAILAVAGSVVLWRGEPEVVSSVQTHQLDARRDLGASEQGIYADLRVTLDEIHLLREEQQALPTPQVLADEGLRLSPKTPAPSAVALTPGSCWAVARTSGRAGYRVSPVPS